MIGRMLMAYGEWAEQEITFLSQFLRPGDIAIDIGAHIGTISIPLAHAVGPTGKVFSFEAQRLVYYNLCTNIHLNGLTNVHAVNGAVSDRPGYLSLAEFDISGSTNTGGFNIPLNIESPRESCSTPKIAIDDYMSSVPSCRLIKMDIEGHEPDALQGMKGFLNRTQPIVYVEANTRGRYDKIYRILSDLNYDSYWHAEPHWNERKFRSNPKNIYGDLRDLNMICFPRMWQEPVPPLQKATDFGDVERFQARG